MKKLFALILNFFRSIFKKKQAVPEPVSEPIVVPEPIPKKEWRTPAETRSLLKQLRPGDQIFNEAGNSMVVYRILNRRKLKVLVETDDGQRGSIHFMGLQSKDFGPDILS